MFPFSPQLINIPANVVDIVYTATKKSDLLDGIHTSIATKTDACFHDISKIKLPKNMCPFGCKVKKCPFEWSADKCPHNLEDKTVPELVDYMLKMQYYEDEDVDVDMALDVDPKMIEAIQNYKTPGNYRGAD